MSERKVLNKYYPPDYDPAKIPKLKLAKDRQYVIRVMAPFHMRCKTCGNYIYKGTKFNSRKETVQDDDYIGLRIFRFYIKCTKCVAEITFKTDPENQDYAIEHGATRNFEAEKLLQQQEKREREQEEEDESNPMKVLEKRTKDSKREMELLENLEELRDLNQRQANINYDNMLGKYQETKEERKKREQEEDEKAVKEIFNSSTIRRLNDKSEDKPNKRLKTTHEKPEKSEPASLLSDQPKSTTTEKSKTDKTKLLGIVRKSTNSTGTKDLKKDTVKPEPAKPAATNTLGLLCDYGSSSSDEG